MEKNIWAFDPGTKKIEVAEGHGAENGISIRAVRLENKISLKCRLRIDISKAKKSVSVEIGLMDITKDILGLREYGFILQTYEAMAIKIEIEKNFDELLVEEVDAEGSWAYSKEVFVSILEMVAEYFDGIDADNGLHLITTSDFTKLLAGSKFDYVSVPLLKWELSKQGYTKCNKGRSDYQSKNEKGKTARFIAFYSERLNETEHS